MWNSTIRHISATPPLPIKGVFHSPGNSGEKAPKKMFAVFRETMFSNAPYLTARTIPYSACCHKVRCLCPAQNARERFLSVMQVQELTLFTFRREGGKFIPSFQAALHSELTGQNRMPPGNAVNTRRYRHS